MTLSSLQPDIRSRARELVDLTRAVEALADRLDSVGTTVIADGDACALVGAHLDQHARTLSDCAVRAASLASFFRTLALVSEHASPEPAQPRRKRAAHAH